MINRNIEKIVPQIPGEPTVSYQRLIIMLKKGIRTLQELQQYLEKEEPQLKVQLSYLEKCSAKYNWTERRKKYQDIKDQELREETEQIFTKLNTTSIHEMQEFLEDLHTLRKDVMKRFKDPTQKFNSSSALKALNDYTTCYNRATEIYYINSRHSLVPKDEETRENNQGVNSFLDWIHTMRGEQ